MSADLKPEAALADIAYSMALRIRAWAKAGMLLLVPAFLWKNGRYAKAYHRYIEQPEQKVLYGWVVFRTCVQIVT